jgi:hypothetical protein
MDDKQLRAEAEALLKLAETHSVEYLEEYLHRREIFLKAVAELEKLCRPWKSQSVATGQGDSNPLL